MGELLGVEYRSGLTTKTYAVESTSQMKYSTRETNDPPLLGEVEAAFGTASEVGEGFVGVLNPSGAGTSCYVCVCDGTNWFYTSCTLLT